MQKILIKMAPYNFAVISLFLAFAVWGGLQDSATVSTAPTTTAAEVRPAKADRNVRVAAHSIVACRDLELLKVLERLILASSPKTGPMVLESLQTGQCVAIERGERVGILGGVFFLQVIPEGSTEVYWVANAESRWM